MALFSITYERWDEKSLDIGETDERGFVLEGATLRDALRETGTVATQANEWPIRSPRWFDFHFTNDGTREYYEHGIEENRALHIPDSVTDASRRRIARLLGLKVGRN